MSVYYQGTGYFLLHGDALAELQSLPDASVDCVVTSPPYFGLRDYGVEGQLGLESAPIDYVKAMRDVFAEARRVLSDDGTLWLNLGDSYNAYNGNRGEGTGFSRNEPMPKLPRGAGLTDASLPAKSLLGIPWRVAFALQDDGWVLRNALVWHKPNPMPSPVKDRLVNAHEMVFLFSKRSRYWFDLDVLREPLKRPEAAGHKFGGKGGGRLGSTERQTGSVYTPGTRGRNPGDVWTISTKPFKGAHFATMPIDLAERCVQAGCRPNGIVLDPFTGSGTTGLAALKHGRRFIGSELNPEYLEIAKTRLDAAIVA